jgi:Skp family chaperone for outer membrane proteins
MKLRLLFLLVFLGIFTMACNNPKNDIKDDALKLIKMEKQIVDLTIQLTKEESKALEQERDSISDILQNLSQELQRKYRDADLTKEFQQAYSDLKTKK